MSTSLRPLHEIAKDDYTTYSARVAASLRLDELAKVQAIALRQGFTLKISGNDQTFADFDAVSRVMGYTPKRLTLTFVDSTGKDHGSLELQTYGDDGEWYIAVKRNAVALAWELVALLRERKSKDHGYAFLSMYVVGFLLIVLPPLIDDLTTLQEAVCQIVGFSTWIARWILKRWLRTPSLVLRYEHAAGFWARNSEDLTKGVILLVIGSVIGVLTTLLIK